MSSSSSTGAAAAASATDPLIAAEPHALWPGLLLALFGAIAFSGKAIIVKQPYFIKLY